MSIWQMGWLTAWPGAVFAVQGPSVHETKCNELKHFRYEDESSPE
jgi:hypothetical protein